MHVSSSSETQLFLGLVQLATGGAFKDSPSSQKHMLS